MTEPSPTTDVQSNPWVEFDLSPQGQRSFWSILSWPFGWIPSTAERRLVYYLGATAQVCPAGKHLIPISEALARPKSTRRRPAFRIGWVAMTPSVREVPVGPIWSRDGIEFTATFSFVLTPIDASPAIARLACGGSEEEKRVINTLQRAAQSVLIGMDADMALASLTDVFIRIQKAAEDSLRGVDLPFSVLEPRVESCRPIDPKVAMTSLERQRLRAEALLEAERSKQIVERAERDARVREVQLENELANERREKEAELQRADLQRAFEIKQMIADAEAAIENDKRKAAAAPEIASAEADRDWIKAQAADAAAKLIEKRQMDIAKLKAELAGTSAGQRVLFPKEYYDLQKERVRYATTIMNELRGLCEQGAFFGGQYDALRKILERTMNVQLREYAAPISSGPLPDPMSDGPAAQRNGPRDAPETPPDQDQQTSSEEENVRSEESPA